MRKPQRSRTGVRVLPQAEVPGLQHPCQLSGSSDWGAGGRYATLNLEVGALDLLFICVPNLLCDFVKVIPPLWASVKLIPRLINGGGDEH